MEDKSKKSKEKKEKPAKGDSYRKSLEMFKQGMSVEEIAKERSLIVSTIFSHLTRFIATGEIQPEALIGSNTEACRNFLPMPMESFRTMS